MRVPVASVEIMTDFHPDFGGMSGRILRTGERGLTLELDMELSAVVVTVNGRDLPSLVPAGICIIHGVEGVALPSGGHLSDRLEGAAKVVKKAKRGRPRKVRKVPDIRENITGWHPEDVAEMEDDG